VQETRFELSSYRCVVSSLAISGAPANSVCMFSNVWLHGGRIHYIKAPGAALPPAHVHHVWPQQEHHSAAFVA
jgi:hypothetical protein